MTVESGSTGTASDPLGLGNDLGAAMATGEGTGGGTAAGGTAAGSTSP